MLDTKAKLPNTYNSNLRQFFHVTIGNTGSVPISAMKLSAVKLPRQKLKSIIYLGSASAIFLLK